MDEAVTLIEANPRDIGTEMRGRWRGVWKYVVRRYRILYRISGSQDQDVVLDSLLYRPRGYPRHPSRRARR